MKKIIIFLITLIVIIPKCANATTTTFYEANYIDNIWMNKVTPDRQTIYYQKARMFRDKTTNKLAYCIEPFEMFNENSTYESTTTPNNLTQEQIKRIKQIAYLGYGQNLKETDEWYAVTQLMIWQTADPAGDYYFTDSLNGNRTNKYQYLIDELNENIKNYNENPDFKKEYIITTTDKIEITDRNSYKTIYKTDNPYTTIENNQITIENLPIGIHEISIIKEEDPNNIPILFYHSENSQNLMTIGKLEPQEIKIKVKVVETEIKIKKVDNDTNSTTPSGNAKLEGTTYQLYDIKLNKISQLIINESSTASIKNLPFGTYYLQEIIPGEGYELDKSMRPIKISESTPKIELKLKNKVIKGKLEINKVYIDNNKEISEANISFNIYNKNNELYTTIKTNELGYATINLPYGTYKVEQSNTTEGYDYIEPFTITIKDNSTITYNLTNDKIKGKLEIYKVYIDINKEIPEGNISFNIYNENNELYTTIKTDENGHAIIDLPYGTYKVEQSNTTKGYDYIEPFTIVIKDNSTLTYNLTNYKIKVPNTYTEIKNRFTIIELLIEIIRKILCN